MHGQHSTIVRDIDLAFNVGAVAGLTDAQLVEGFLAWRGPRAEAAFAALVRRHGPMVQRVCRSILRDHHDAQDACQATFLVLARKAGSLRVGDSLGPWLHGVACRVAGTARAAAARRRAHESRAAGMTPILVSDGSRDDVGPIIHEEIARMPERYRAPVVLCDLEGRTYEEAARVLGRPVGTIKSRLARGREHLRGRMIRRGVAPAAFASAGFLSAGSARSAVCTASIDATARIAMRLAAGHAAADVMPSSVLVLMEGAIKMMFLSRLKLVAAVLLVGCGASFVPVIRGESRSGESGPVAGRSGPAQAEVAGSKPPTLPPRPFDRGAPSARPWETAVRLRVLDEKSVDFGSGTIIHSTADDSLILASAHQFRLDEPSPPGEFPRRIKVDLYDGKPQGAAAPQEVHFLETVDGELVDCDFRRDISLIRIRPGRRLPASRIVPRRWEPRVGMKMLTIGCSEGNDPTAWHTRITNPRYRGLSGNPEYEAIECQTAPKQGRTGGGLFTAEDDLAGVCNFAEPQGDQGLYATPDSIHRLLDRNHLTFLYAAPVVAEEQLDDLFRDVERQLEEGDREGANRTIRRLDALIAERRVGLQDALRSLEINDSHRRDELLRRASERRPEARRDPAPPEPLTPEQADAGLDRILDEWHRRSADRTSLDVRFTVRERDPRWAEDETRPGRVVLTSAGRGLVEVKRGAEGTRNEERIIWTDDALHQFLLGQKTHNVWPIAASDRGRIVAALALPFCWHLTAESLKARYDVELLPEQQPGTWLLRFIPKTKLGRESFSKAYLELDRSTYLPKRYILYMPDGRTTKSYSVTDARCNQPIPDELWRLPDDSGWKVIRLDEGLESWISRLIKLDLVP